MTATLAICSHMTTCGFPGAFFVGFHAQKNRPESTRRSFPRGPLGGEIDCLFLGYWPLRPSSLSIPAARTAAPSHRMAYDANQSSFIPSSALGQLADGLHRATLAAFDVLGQSMTSFPVGTLDSSLTWPSDHVTCIVSA